MAIHRIYPWSQILVKPETKKKAKKRYPRHNKRTISQEVITEFRKRHRREPFMKLYTEFIIRFGPVSKNYLRELLQNELRDNERE